uniref:Uncharacterized protein LOC104243312 n=1 Tax=Nicotiana sylvestris TaxID=4096 RepID=A0A1U7YC17_NICSY|nr:PREDICTED: uncharacterized protein LOC104243312 [Nicotiana sylvestris]
MALAQGGIHMIEATLRVPSSRHFRFLMSFRGGRTGRQGQQSQQPRACYGCGDPSHIVRFCPQASSSSQQQGPRPTIQAVGDPQAAQPARGGGRDHRGGGRDRRGGARTARGRGQPAADRPRDTVQGGRGQPRCYALPARPEAESSDDVIIDSLKKPTIMSNQQENPRTPPLPSPSNSSSSTLPSLFPKSRLRRVKMLARKTVASGDLRKALNERLKVSQVKESQPPNFESRSKSESYKSATEGEGHGSSDSEKIQESPSEISSSVIENL